MTDQPEPTADELFDWWDDEGPTGEPVPPDPAPGSAAGCTSIVACRHSMNGRRVPCPSRCPQQDWPRSMFRLDWRGRYVLRRRYRKADHVD